MSSTPLAGLKVLDLSTLLPGPYATLMLADLGAEVLRVESATRPDLVRALSPQVAGASAAHHYLNRNKRSLALDLKKPGAAAIIEALIDQYDILVEQFRPGVMARLGLDYARLSQLNPRLIYCSITGYGQTGPYAARAGHDLNYLALSGLSSYTGRHGSGPLPLGLQVADIAGGSHHAVMGILAAVIQRQRSGRGQYLDISMTDAAFALNGLAGAAALASGDAPHAEGDWLNGGSFYDYYRTRDGRYLACAGLEPVFIQRLAEALDAPELLTLSDLQDPKRQRTLKRRLQALFAARDWTHWCERFAATDACVEPVLDLLEAADHPQLQARGMLLELSLAGVRVRQIACPIRFSQPQSEPRPAPLPGDDNHSVLAELGYAPEEIQALVEQGVVETGAG